MKKYYARIEISKADYEAREKSVKLDTIFGSVYAPKSKTSIESDMGNNLIIVVPCWVFWNKELNPCQMTSGFLGQISNN